MNPEYRISTDKRFGERIVVVEFTREELEKLVTLYGPDDAFTKDVRAAMHELDRAEEAAT